MSEIHPTAHISSSAFIGKGVQIGAFCVVEDDTHIGADCRIAAHVCIKRGTHLGSANRLAEGVVLGGHPQHVRADDVVGRLLIGARNTIRENVTIHVGLREGHCTEIGDDNLLMVNAHVGHDCHLGNGNIIANNVMLAGHVTLDDFAYLSGAAGVHQFCRVGSYCMVGGQARITKDVPPFVTVDGNTSKLVGLNQIGLRRRGFQAADLAELKAAYRLVFRSDLPWKTALERLGEEFPQGAAAVLHKFLVESQRGVVTDRGRVRAPAEATTNQPLILRKAG